MKERPILFSGPMVRAILDGRKTQTRRILHIPPGWDLGTAERESCRLGMITSPHPKKNRFGAFVHKEIHPGSGKCQHDIVPCKYGKPGDRLWVRESLVLWPGSMDYKADGVPVPINTSSHQQWSWFQNYKNASCPSIHMPRWASRIALEICDVRVERLNAIREEDAKAEGATPIHEPNEMRWQHYSPYGVGFTQLWESINGPGSWDANPWVWVVEFRRL